MFSPFRTFISAPLVAVVVPNIATCSSNSDFMKGWNSNDRWTRAYIDDGFDPMSETDVAIYSGPPDTALAEQVCVWLECWANSTTILGTGRPQGASWLAKA